MKVAASVELVWQMAGQEAIAGEFREILPEHFLVALLKLCELSAGEIEKIFAGAEAAKAITADMTTVRQEIQDRSIDSTRARRELRGVLGRGGAAYDGGRMHRSLAARSMCDVAARLAEESGSDTLTAAHLLNALLAAPTAHMAKALGHTKGAASDKNAGTPLLDELGLDLTRMASEGKTPIPSGRRAESRLVLGALGRKECGIVLLVTDSEAAAREVIDGAIHTALGQDRQSRAERLRIVDITGAWPSTEGPAPLDLIGKLLAEARSAANVILVVPPILAGPMTDRPGGWVNALQVAAAKGSPKCICRIDARACQQWVEKDRTWRKLARTVWIAEARKGDVPAEL